METVHTEIFTICENAVVNQSGTLAITGVCNTITTLGFPAKVLPFYVVARIRFETPRIGQHDWRLSLIDADAKPLREPIGNAMDIELMDDSIYAWKLIRAEVKNVVFHKPGGYSFNLEIDNELISSVPFLVRSE